MYCYENNKQEGRMPNREENETTPYVKEVVSSMWDGFLRAAGNGVVGVQTKDHTSGVSAVVDIAEQEIFLSKKISGGKLDIGSFAGTIGDPRGLNSGLVSAPTENLSQRASNINGGRYQSDEIFQFQGRPVTLDAKAGEQSGRGALQGTLTSTYNLSENQILSYGASIAIVAGQHGFIRSDVFADVKQKNDNSVLSGRSQISAHMSGSDKDIRANFNVSYDRTLSETAGLTLLANGYLSGSSRGDVAAGADVGIYKDLPFGELRAGPYVGVDTRSGAKAGFALQLPFGY
jgi:hypothetical protein